jgi:hypothetical protein
MSDIGNGRARDADVRPERLTSIPITTAPRTPVIEKYTGVLAVPDVFTRGGDRG